MESTGFLHHAREGEIRFHLGAAWCNHNLTLSATEKLKDGNWFWFKCFLQESQSKAMWTDVTEEVESDLCSLSLPRFP